MFSLNNSSCTGNRFPVNQLLINPRCVFELTLCVNDALNRI